MLGSVGSTNFDVELVATVAGADDNGAANEAAEGFEDFLAELLQRGDVRESANQGDRNFYTSH